MFMALCRYREWLAMIHKSWMISKHLLNVRMCCCVFIDIITLHTEAQYVICDWI